VAQEFAAQYCLRNGLLYDDGSVDFLMTKTTQKPKYTHLFAFLAFLKVFRTFAGCRIRSFLVDLNVS
jgi:hypothetical protein